MTRRELSMCCLTAVMVLGLFLQRMQKAIKASQTVISKLTVKVCISNEIRNQRKWLESRV